MKVSESEQLMKREARRFRQEQGLSDTEPLAVRSLLAKLGVLAVFRPLSGGFSGMAMLKQENPFMLINSSQSIGRQNFSICHELYHLFIEKRTIAQISYAGRFPEKDEHELQADWFAAHLLLPATGLEDVIPLAEQRRDKLSVATFLHVQHLYRCSRVVLLRSLKEKGIISSVGYERLNQESRQQAGLYGYTNYLNKLHDAQDPQTAYIIGGYGQLAKQLYDLELIGDMEYFAVLRHSGSSPEQQTDRLDEED